jgi:uncharacterized protein (TIGR02453 family)
MGRFEGFKDADGKFFKALAKNQSREWFQAHKDDFEEGWNLPMKSLLAEVHDAIDSAFPHCDLDGPKVFRIFRDVRFSKDKSPYKTHIGGFIATKLGGKTMEVPFALYMHVGQPHSFAAAGHYMMSGPQLERFRKAVADDKRGKELDKILAKLAKKKFTIDSHDALKRAPKGFDPDHPRIDMLKRKGLTVSFPAMPKGALATRKLVPWIIAGVKETAPLVEWLVFATR